nr:hypothetical protein [uncultured Lacibacter sp.]
MKQSFVILLLLMGSYSLKAQLTVKPDCGILLVDVHKGWINETKPNADPEQIKARLPCFTSAEKEGNTATCGGGVFLDNKGVRYYTLRDYIVITDKFKGKFTVPVLGVKKAAMFPRFGNPKLKDANWEAYTMAYGIMIVYYNTASVVNKVIISTKTTDDISLCTTN